MKPFAICMKDGSLPIWIGASLDELGVVSRDSAVTDESTQSSIYAVTKAKLSSVVLPAPLASRQLMQNERIGEHASFVQRKGEAIPNKFRRHVSGPSKIDCSLCLPFSCFSANICEGSAGYLRIGIREHDVLRFQVSVHHGFWLGLDIPAAMPKMFIALVVSQLSGAFPEASRSISDLSEPFGMSALQCNFIAKNLLTFAGFNYSIS